MDSGTADTPATGSPPEPPGPSAGDAPTPYWPPPPAEPQPIRRPAWDGASIAALVVAIPGILIAAVPLGIAGLIRTRGRARRGRGLAVTGLVLSGAWTVVLAVAAGTVLMFAAQKQAPAVAASPPAPPAVQASPLPSESPTAAPSPPPPPPAPSVKPKKVHITKIRVGHCIHKIPKRDFVTLPVVPCAQAHEVEIYAIRRLSGGRWPGDKAIGDRADKACKPVFEEYVGLSYDISFLEISWYAPTRGAWRAGAREVTCLLYDPDGTLYGSMKGRGH